MLAAAVLVGLRAPTAFRSFGSAAAAAQGRDAFGGALALADSLNVDNGFVASALEKLPDSAHYEVLLPVTSQVAQDSYGIAPLTFDALPDVMTDILLPRLPVVAPGKGDYVLCYACDTTPWDHRTRWLWRDTRGHAIGLVQR